MEKEKIMSDLLINNYGVVFKNEFEHVYIPFSSISYITNNIMKKHIEIDVINFYLKTQNSNVIRIYTKTGTFNKILNKFRCVENNAEKNYSSIMINHNTNEIFSTGLKI